LKGSFLIMAFSVAILLTSMPALATSDTMLRHVEAEDIEPTAKNGWGLKVSEHPGNYGGMNADPEEDGRLVTDVGADNPAYYKFKRVKARPTKIKIRHLDGIADDSFKLEVKWC